MVARAMSTGPPRGSAQFRARARARDCSAPSSLSAVRGPPRRRVHGSTGARTRSEVDGRSRTISKEEGFRVGPVELSGMEWPCKSERSRQDSPLPAGTTLRRPEGDSRPHGSADVRRSGSWVQTLTTIPGVRSQIGSGSSPTWGCQQKEAAMARWLHRPSGATVISCIALVMAMSGGAVAATTTTGSHHASKRLPRR